MGGFSFSAFSRMLSSKRIEKGKMKSAKYKMSLRKGRINKIAIGNLKFSFCIEVSRFINT
jgi:hypothetical protein